MTIGRKIKQLRQSYDMTVREFAAKVGVSPSYISRLESERGFKPSTSILEKIAKACNKDLSYFFEPKIEKIDLKQYLEYAPPHVKKLLEDDDAPSYIEIIADMKQKGLTPDEIRGVFAYIEKYFLRDKKE